MLATAVLGVVAMRLAGSGVFWYAAVLAHILGTLLVYAGVWIADAANPSGLAVLLHEADFGVSLVWCAALGVLAGVAWWKTRPLRRWAWRLLAAGPPLALLGVTLVSDGLARYEHVAAFALAVGVVYASQRWSSVGSRLRLLGPADDQSPGVLRRTCELDQEEAPRALAAPRPRGSKFSRCRTTRPTAGTSARLSTAR